MDTHFPSGKARTPAKQLNEETATEDIVRQMKSIEKQLKNIMLTDAKRK